MIRLALLALAVCLAVPAQATAGVTALNPEFLSVMPATLTGTVTDSTTGESLIGAVVRVDGTALGAATDGNGRYRLAGVPSGPQVLRVSYIGYLEQRIEVSVPADGALTVDVALVPDVVLGEEVVVTAQAVGQNAAINQQLSSNTIVNIVSAEKIRELPDANAAESIGRLPGVSVVRSGGEANRIVLRGLSGAFTNITVDGIQVAATDPNSRNVDLSSVSQGSLAGIELFKALTPDKDADAIAGSVNLVTRRAPQRRELRVSALGSYNGLTSSAGQYDLNGAYGERFLNGLLGIQVTANAERRDRSNQQFSPGYRQQLVDGTNDTEFYQITSLDLAYTDEVRRRNGIGTILDVNTPDRGFVKLSALYNHTSRNFLTSSRTYVTGGSETVFYSARDREQGIGLFTGALTGENYFLGLKSTYGLSYARSSSSNPYDNELVFTEPSLFLDGEAVAGTRNITPEIVRDVNNPEGIIPFAVNNVGLSSLYSGFFRTEEARDADLSAYLNLSRGYRVGSSISGEFKVGGKYRDKSRSRDRTETLSPYAIIGTRGFVRQDDGTIVPKDFTSTMFGTLLRDGPRVLATNFVSATPRTEDLYGGRFNLNPVLDRDAVRAWYEYNRNGVNASGSESEYQENVETSILFYDIAERVTAGYAMHTLNVGDRVTLITGLRMERENNDYLSRYSREELSGFPIPTAQPGAIRDTTSAFAETVWLPNTQLLVRATDWLNVRVAAYRALARPDFNSRLASVSFRQSSSFFPGNSVTLGNPDLRAAKAWNYEINTSFYGRRLGLFSVSAFYKDISEYFQTISGLPFSGNQVFETYGFDYRRPTGNESRFVLTAPFNSQRPTTVRGIEVEHQMTFGFLPFPLSGLVLAYNGTIVRSSTVIPTVRTETVLVQQAPPPFPPTPQTTYVPTETTQKLQEQPDFIANVALGYDYRAFSARVSMAHQGLFYTRFGDGVTSDAAQRGGFTRWDLAIKQGIGSQASLVLNINNITGVEETRLRYNEALDQTLTTASQIYGTTVDLGVRFNL